MTNILTNVVFDEITIGQSAEMTRQLEMKDLKTFAYVSGDVNPIHLSQDYASTTQFKQVIAHGMWAGGLISCVLGTQLPGVGTVYMGQSLRFRRPVYLGDTLTTTVTVTEKIPEKKRVILECIVTNQDNEIVVKGEAEVIAPTEKITCEAAKLPEVSVN